MYNKDFLLINIEEKIVNEADSIWELFKGKSVKEIKQIIHLLTIKIDTNCQAQ